MSLPRTLILSLAVLAIPVAYADYSTGFENPPFVTGPIAGQDGWNLFGPGISTVENFFAKTGTQAVFVDGSTPSQSGPWHSDSPVGPLIDLSADVAIFTSSNQTEWQFAGLGPSLAPFIGGIDITPTNDILAITAGFPVIGSFPRATMFDGTAWHHVDLLFNMTAQTYNIALDGSQLAANVPFCGNNGPCGGPPVAAYGSSIFDSFGGVAGGNDSGYMDNFSVGTASPVPEPSSFLPLVAFMTGLGGLVYRKRSASK